MFFRRFNRKKDIRINSFKESIKLFQSYANKHIKCTHDCGKGNLDSILDQVRQLEEHKDKILETLDDSMDYEDCTTQAYFDSENVDESSDCNDSEDCIAEDENTEFELYKDFESLSIESEATHPTFQQQYHADKGENVIEAKKKTIANSRKRKKTFDHTKTTDNGKKTADKDEKKRTRDEKV